LISVEKVLFIMDNFYKKTPN